jgi:hypothetical protein
MPKIERGDFHRRTLRGPYAAKTAGAGKGTRPFKCSLCNRSFKTLSAAIEHERVKHEEALASEIGSSVSDNPHARLLDTIMEVQLNKLQNGDS